MKIYFVRHGESEANVLREFSISSTRHPLTANGVAQANALAFHMADKHISAIYSSPVLRAVQTANILGSSLGLEVQLANELSEWSVGELEGTRDQDGWDRHTRVQEDWFIRHNDTSKIPGGESYLEIQARFMPFIDRILLKHHGQSHNLVLVAHGGLYVAMLPLLLKNLGRDYSLHANFPNTGYVLAEPRDGGLFCLEWCGKVIA